LNQTGSPQSTSTHYLRNTIDNNRHRTFCNGTGGRTTGLQTLVR